MNLPDFTEHLQPLLNAEGITWRREQQLLLLQHGSRQIRCQVLLHGQEESRDADFLFPLDLLLSKPSLFIARCKSLLKLNTVVYARQCVPKKITKEIAAQFLNANHLMGATSSARQYGLYYGETLVCVATYSAGRKMNRLPPDQRSFELIRFCTKAGITVTGGLSRLLKQFITDHQPGDIMTFIDQQLFTGAAYLQAGFQLQESSSPHHFRVSKKDYLRGAPVSERLEETESHYFYSDKGNLKLILLPH